MIDLNIESVSLEPVPLVPTLMMVDGYRVDFCCGCRADCERESDTDFPDDSLLGFSTCDAHVAVFDPVALVTTVTPRADAAPTPLCLIGECAACNGIGTRHGRMYAVDTATTNADGTITTDINVCNGAIRRTARLYRRDWLRGYANYRGSTTTTVTLDGVNINDLPVEFFDGALPAHRAACRDRRFTR